MASVRADKAAAEKTTRALCDEVADLQLAKRAWEDAVAALKGGELAAISEKVDKATRNVVMTKLRHAQVRAGARTARHKFLDRTTQPPSPLAGPARPGAQPGARARGGGRQGGGVLGAARAELDLAHAPALAAALERRAAAPHQPLLAPADRFRARARVQRSP